MSHPDFSAPLERCPHCGSDARLTPHAVYRFSCGVCGKPRLPLDGRELQSDAQTTQLLASAYRSRLAKFAWQWASLGSFSASFGLGVFGLGFSHWLEFGLLGNSVAAGLTLLPLTLGLLFWSQSKKAVAASSLALSQAWQSVVKQLFAKREGRLTAEALTRVLGVDLEQATLLLAEAEVAAWMEPSAPQRLRVEPEASELDLGLDSEAAKLMTERDHGQR